MFINNFIAVYDTKSTKASIIRIPFFPDEVSEQFQADWSPASVVGRPVPVGVYTGTGYRSVSFSFDTHRELHEDIEGMLKALKGTVYSMESDDGYIPKLCIVNIGLFRAKGYITSVQYQWKKPIIDNKYQVCSVSIQMNAIDMGNNAH